MADQLPVQEAPTADDPKALVTNHKKLPNHYINHYLNQQSHFCLKDAVVGYHGNLVQEWNPK